MRRSASPSGRHELHVDSEEVRMSHWIDMPYVVSTTSGETVFSLLGTSWSVDADRWLMDDGLELVLRKYPGDRPSITVVVHAWTREVTIEGVRMSEEAAKAWFRGG